MATALPDAAPVAAPRRLRRRRTFGDFLTQVVLPVLAVGLLAFAGWFVWRNRVVIGNPPPPIPPARNPFPDAVAAAGVVEAQTENIAVGSALPGVVVEVLVTVDDEVQPGTPLFRLDDRELRADLAVRRAAVSQAKSDLLRLESEPRPEKIPVVVAQVNEARAAVVRETDALRRAEETFARKVTTEQEVIARREALAGVQAALEKTEADLALLKAGSWAYDLDVSQAGVAKAEAEVQKIETDLDRLVVRSLVAGRVLQVNVRPGEFVGAPPGQPLVIVGNIDRLHVRVDIDEFDIPRFDSRAPASAVPRGSLQERYPLSFVRVEPFVVPKKSLTGDNTERVDTRVLQVIYACDPTNRPPLFVGQQVEVYVEAAGRGAP
ncbi:MAG: biotin/lipoyl-binding protein [Planctomycetia bacterium]|nr:biotin/lipoyl-binding protein [Planctomycetia bacterium]